MPVRKKKFRVSALRAALDTFSIPPPRPHVNRYRGLFRFSICHIEMAQLCDYLECYQAEIKATHWSSDVLRRLSGRCVNYFGLIESECERLDDLHCVTRYLLSKLALNARLLRCTGVVRVPLARRHLAKLGDGLLMGAIVSKLPEEMQRWREGDHNAVYRAYCYYVRLRGLSVFCLDRHDAANVAADPQLSFVYVVDGIPFMFIVPFTTPIDVICTSLGAVFGSRARPEVLAKHVRLYQAIVSAAAELHLTRDHFSDELQRLLQFQPTTLTSVDRQPGRLAHKFPAEHSCPFRKLTVELANGFGIVIKAKGRHENLVEALYEAEKSGYLSLPANIVSALARGERNRFRPADLM